MEVNDVRVSGLPINELNVSVGSTTRDLEKTAVSKAESDAVRVDTHHTKETLEHRLQTNRVINVINVAKSATDEIEKLVKSVAGIAEIAQGEKLSDKHIITLENEANQIVSEISKLASSAEASGVKPLAGDKIRFEVEERFGKALDIVFPDSAKEAFGIGRVSFSPKESILDTIARVQSAEQQLVSLRDSVSHASDSIRQAFDAFEVSLQNKEAASASVRSVDEALQIASSAEVSIGKNPKEALASVGDIDLQSSELLK